MEISFNMINQNNLSEPIISKKKKNRRRQYPRPPSPDYYSPPSRTYHGDRRAGDRNTKDTENKHRNNCPHKAPVNRNTYAWPPARYPETAENRRLPSSESTPRRTKNELSESQPPQLHKKRLSNASPNWL